MEADRFPSCGRRLHPKPVTSGRTEQDRRENALLACRRTGRPITLGASHHPMVTAAPPVPFRLLLVEDEAPNAVLLQEMVESGRGKPFEVAAQAGSLEEAIALVERQSFDAVL